MSPLTIACRDKRFGMAKLLLENGASAERLKEDAPSPLQAASWAGSLELVRMLLVCRPAPDINAAFNGMTALYRAAGQGHLEVAELLLQNGAQVYWPRNGKTPLYNAALNDRLDTAKLLLQHGAPIVPTDPLDDSPFHAAVFDGHMEIVEELFRHTDDAGALANLEWGRQNCPLMQAAWGGHLEIVNFLLEHGAHPDYRNSRTQQIILHNSSAGGNLAVFNRILEIVRPEWVDEQDSDGWTSLFYAAAKGHYAMVARLIELGANVLHKTPVTYGILHAAAEGGNVKVVDLLLSAHPELNIAEETARGFTPLQFVSQLGSFGHGCPPLCTAKEPASTDQLRPRSLGLAKTSSPSPRHRELA
jgi:ankyrin repeat protein